MKNNNIFKNFMKELSKNEDLLTYYFLKKEFKKKKYRKFYVKFSFRWFYGIFGLFFLIFFQL